MVNSFQVEKKKRHKRSTLLRVEIDDNETFKTTTTSSDSILTVDIDVEKDIFYEKCLSRGHACSVWRCSIGGWSCVVKMMEKNNVTEEDLSALRREAVVLSTLPYQHPSIVRFLASWENDSVLCMFMSEYRGGNIRNVLDKAYKAKHRIENYVIESWAVSVAKGLLFLHSNSIIHRDIKAANILLDWNHSTAVISDFDVSKFIACNSPGAGPRPHSRVGTPAWMPPEMLREQSAVYSVESDIYSYGMFVYELFTLKIPYANISPFQMQTHILSGVLPEVHPEDFVESPTLHMVFKKACNSDPNKRLSASEVLNFLCP